PDVDELTAECADRKLGPELRRSGAARDHEHVARELARIRVLAHLDPTLGGASDKLARDLARLRDAVLPARVCAEYVVDAEADDSRGVDLLDGNAETLLERCAFGQAREPGLGGRDEHVPDLLEERRPELREECVGRACEPHLSLSRELLAEAAHRLPGGT